MYLTVGLWRCSALAIPTASPGQELRHNCCHYLVGAVMTVADRITSLEEAGMGTRIGRVAAILLTAGSITATACGGGKSTTAGGDAAMPPNATTNTAAPVTAAAPTMADTTTFKHHSKLGGAMAGAAAGHMLGGHAIAGAAAGALIQHERNKHERERMRQH